ncbi:unnamed protein product [Aspergillus oryzae var. brunneus]|uniref:Unnamed protein product n=2 Tax=Aspergillus oryzae TaxID=5062 RepID=A0AAN5C0W6_ASPOZ|nr:unnamed protein product [Aspergillus oryzae]GMG52483.1 unnamed protein product [Aspergillus oryzae var. brunneus]
MSHSPTDIPSTSEKEMESTPEKPPKQACDNCRRRKIKCSRELPCDKCQRLLLSCSYSDVLRRKGPKFRTLYPLAPIHPLASRPRPLTKEWLPPNPGACHLASPTSPPSTVADAQYLHPDFSESFTRLPPPDLVSSPDSTNSLFDSSTIGALPAPRRLSTPNLLAHVNVFLKYLFPIMPVVRQDQLQQDCHQPERLSPQRYAFIAALCAATHIQLKLDGAAPGPEAASARASLDGHPMLSGEELLAEAVRARKEYNVVDEINMENLLTSFFLFAAYGNLDRQDQAWFYLCQTTSMVFTLGLQRESTYSKLSVEEAEEKRRVLCSDDPILAYGFINLINVFEKLSPNLYDWVSAGGSSADGDPPPTSSIQSSLAKQISLEGVSEIQKVDILITQQWLQTMMWKLSMTHVTQPGSRDDAVLPFHLPVLVGKAVMGVIAAASQGAVDAHGIGMVRKRPYLITPSLISHSPSSIPAI